MGHFSDPGTRWQPRHQNVRPDESVVCMKYQDIQLNEEWQILKKLKRSPLSHTQRNKPLNFGPYRLHANKSYTETCGSANQTWTCVISFIAITMSEKNLKQTNQRNAFAWCHMMSFHELVIAHDEGKNYTWERLCGDQDTPLCCLMAVGGKKTCVCAPSCTENTPIYCWKSGPGPSQYSAEGGRSFPKWISAWPTSFFVPSPQWSPGCSPGHYSIIECPKKSHAHTQGHQSPQQVHQQVSSENFWR